MTRGLGPVKKAPEVKLSANPVQHRHDDGRRGGRLRDLVALVVPGR